MDETTVYPGIVRLQGLTVRACHGVLEHERQFAQTFVVDCVLTVDMEAAIVSDDLKDAVDYGVIAQLIEQVVVGMQPFALIESLAGHIAQTMLEHDPRIIMAEVTVHKPQAPVTPLVQDVAVTIKMGR